MSSKQWPVKEILGEAIEQGRRLYQVRWEPTWSTYNDFSEWDYEKLLREDNGKFLVEWKPTWEPQWKIKKGAPSKVREWNEKQKDYLAPPPPPALPAASAKSLHISLALPRVVIDSDQEDGSSNGDSLSDNESCSSNAANDASVLPVANERQKDIPGFMFERFADHNLMKEIFQKHHLEHNVLDDPSDMGSDFVRHVYQDIGQSLYKNCSSGYNFSEHQGSMNMEIAIGQEFAPFYRSFADDLVPLNTCIH